MFYLVRDHFPHHAFKKVFPIIGTNIHSGEWELYRALQNGADYAYFTVRQHSLHCMGP